MNEHDWLTGDDPQKMLQSLEREWEKGGTYSLLSDRKLRLFACACWRATGSGVAGVLAYGGIEEADGGPPPHESDHDALALAMAWCRQNTDLPTIFPHPITQVDKAELFRDTVGNPHRSPPFVWMNGGLYPRPERDRLIGDYIGDLTPVPWLTPQVLSLAQAAYEERGNWRCRKHGIVPESEVYEAEGGGHGHWRKEDSCWQSCEVVENGSLDPFRLALLADALEEAGCDYPELLEHLRSPRPHYRGMWSLDLILGKS